VRAVAGLLLVLAAVLLASAAQALASGVTNSADDLRDGWYPEQASLTPQLVSGGTFGQLWSKAVEGSVYAQPLLYNGTLLVATENNKVYGLDPATGAARWPAPLNLGVPWNPGDIGCGDLTPSIGVTATPVIDSTTGTAYLTHKTYASGTSGTARWYMDAVEMATGKEKAGFPVQLSGAAQNQPGMSFQPTTQLQRPGLLLMNGVVYAAFGSHCDKPPWQGWVFGVSTAGQVKARWVSRSSGSGAGIWQSGAGLTSDRSGSLFVATGNGGAPSTAIPGSSPPADLGESIVRLAVQSDGSLKAVDFFAPFDASSLDGWDADFASGGVTGLNEQFFGTPTVPHLAVAVGKSGYVYLLNRDNLGGIKQGPGTSDKVVQRIGPYGGVWSRPGVWPGNGGWVYIPTASGGTTGNGTSGFLRVYQYGTSGTGQPTLSLQATSSDSFGFSSGAPVITSDGTTSGSALVWMVWTPNSSGSGAQLRAYDPLPVGGRPVLRWSAPIGTSSKFSVPGVGAGRIYVGTRDGHVLGFGAPVTQPLTGPTTSFPTTTIGSSSQTTLTLTANNTLTINTLTSNSSQFVAGTPSIPLPAHMTAGQTIQVPLTFTPTQSGLVGGTLSAETTAGNASFAMSGTGQTATAQLTGTPKVVSFGGTAVGGHLSGAATFQNVGGAPLTINAVKLPAAPFGASGVPEAGSTIPAGGSVTVNLSFEPTATGNYSDQIALETTGGNVAIGLTGSAGTPGVLKITPEGSEFGSLAVGGGGGTRSFSVTNTGGTNVTITKSKPPSGGAFAATSTLAEGTSILPGETLTETVAFTPTAPGYASAVWALNGDDSTGLHELKFSGTGTVPAPGSAWSHNGTATITSGVLRTTAATTYAAGSSFFTTPLDSHHLTIEFDQTIGSGTGADGQTLTFADASKATPASLGYHGGGLGFSGIPGIAVAFDTYKNSANPSNNFVGVTNGPGTAADLMHWLFTASPAASLRAKHHVKIDELAGAITVSIDGTQVLSGTAAVPARVLLGFTGSTGGLTDVHEAANVVITGEPAPSGEPPPASLKISTAVNAPAGSPQAATKFTYSGSCPSSFTTSAIGNGESATPTLTGAVGGASCSVSEAAPSGTGWTATASVNGGAAVALTPAGGQLTVPAFALAGGVNTVQFNNTYTPSTGSLIPDPSAGGWQLNGSAVLEAPSLVLTGATSNQAGSAFWPQQLDPHNLIYEFEISIGGGTGADGLALVFADATKGATPTSLGESGGGLGFGGIPGVAECFDTFKNSANPSSNFVGFSNGKGSTAGTLHWLGTVTLATPLRNTTHRIKISTAAGAMALWVDGTKIGALGVTLPAKAYIGFSAGTGTLNDRHAISNLVVHP
jgi:PQQ-like domain